MDIHSSWEADWSIGLILDVTADIAGATLQHHWYLPESDTYWLGSYNSIQPAD